MTHQKLTVTHLANAYRAYNVFWSGLKVNTIKLLAGYYTLNKFPCTLFLTKKPIAPILWSKLNHDSLISASIPKLMRVSDKHQKITLAAIKVFARKGFFNARISDIAKEAKVADGTIYLYFNNKYDILISLFEEEIGKIIIKTKRLLEKEKDPIEMLLLFAKQHLNLLKKHRELVVVLQMELRQSNEFIQEYRNTKFVEYIDIISEIIHKGQEEGLFRSEIMPGIIKRAYFGALDEMTRLWILSPQPHYTLDEAAVQICDVFLNGLVVK